MFSLNRLTTNPLGDLSGGVTAAVVALPLALAFGISSGAGPIAGLYGAIIVGLFAAIFGGTPSQVSGPTGPMTVVMTAMIAGFVAKYPDSGLALSFTTVFLGGCLQAAFGVLRLGKYVVMVPYPVISGFMTGIGVIIIVLQLAPLLGQATQGNVLTAITLLPENIANINPNAAMLGALALAVTFGWRGKANRVLPSPLLALIVVTLAAYFIDPSHTVDRIGTIPSALPSLILPAFSGDLLKEMLVNALMLAVLGSIDSLLTSLVADNVTGTQHDSDRELVGQGIGNAVSGLFGGLPGAGATMRTMVNIRAGGSGPLSGVTHALVLVAVVAGAGKLFESIPLAALAGILIKVGVDIIDWPFLKRLRRLPNFAVFLMFTVFVLTVTVDLITAVFVGVFIKNTVVISKLSDLQLGEFVLSDGHANTELLTPEEQQFLSGEQGETVLLKLTGPISYGTGRGLNLLFDPFKHHQKLVIDIAYAKLIGVSTAMVLEQLVRKSLARNARVALVGADVKLHGELAKMGLIDVVGAKHCFENVTDVKWNNPGSAQ
ncbi:SulP family sulfate permease [Alteromonadaceae bacterium 2753L.S.0a.02]|nr:SulP family sulfate permease [Alteromonadaceae bacterium 2753L.S.0a.02]